MISGRNSLPQHVHGAVAQQPLGSIDQGKGGRDRIVPLSRMACRFLHAYLAKIRPKLIRAVPANRRECDYLFVSARGKPLDKNVLGEMVIESAQAAKVKKHITCHIWRHTCATHLLNNRANLRHVQELLGHRSLATTERYLHLSIADLKEAHRRFYPREQSWTKGWTA